MKLNIVIAMIVVLFALPTSSATALPDRPALEEWERLLYYVNGQSLVKSEHYFLSEDGANNLVQELNVTIELLNSPHGEMVACNFPSRYLWIKQQGYNVNTFELHNCTDLDKFINSFQRKNVSLVFASEHVDYPSSVFGHVFLLFHENDNDLLLADSIQFVAETDKESLLKYIYKGVTGGYKGYFFRKPFYVMRETYSYTEQRALHICKLDLSAERVEFLIYFLYELRKAEFDYQFAKENCAYHIAFLLEAAYGAGYNEYRNTKSVLPIDVLNLFQNNIVDEIIIEPSLIRGQYLLSKMTQEELLELNDASNGRISITNRLSNNTKEVLIIEHEYNFRRYQRVLSAYDEVVRLKLNGPLLPSEYADDPMNNRAMLGLGFLSRGDTYGTLLQYRLVGRDIFEVQSSRPRESKVVFMDTEILIDNYSNIILQRLDIIAAMSLFSRGSLGSKLSWAMELGVNRENTLDEAALYGSFSIGHSYAHDHTGIGYLLGAGIQDNNSEGNAYVKPSLYWIYYPGKKLKIGWMGFVKSGAHGKYEESSFFLTIGTSKNAILAKYVMNNVTTEGVLSLAVRHKF